MADDPYLQAVAILVSRGFKLKGEIWGELPWDGDMPEDMLEAFATIFLRMENERVQRLTRI
jgi:hypothetical protein